MAFKKGYSVPHSRGKEGATSFLQGVVEGAKKRYKEANVIENWESIPVTIQIQGQAESIITVMICDTNIEIHFESTDDKVGIRMAAMVVFALTFL